MDPFSLESVEEFSMETRRGKRKLIFSNVFRVMDSEKIPFCKEVKEFDYHSTIRKRRLTKTEEIYEYVNLNGIYFYVDSQGKISR